MDETTARTEQRTTGRHIEIVFDCCHGQTTVPCGVSLVNNNVTPNNATKYTDRIERERASDVDYAS